jgi:hypothetical protein
MSVSMGAGVAACARLTAVEHRKTRRREQRGIAKGETGLGTASIGR